MSPSASDDPLSNAERALPLAPLRLAPPDLPDTLSQRVQVLRERRGWTRGALAERANLLPAFVDDVEAGLEPFLSSTSRRKLARALRVPPSWLHEVEIPAPHLMPLSSLVISSHGEENGENRGLTRDRWYAISANPTHNWPCPQCDAPIIIQRFQRRDLEDRPIVVTKVHCSRCLFRDEQETVY